MHLLSFGLTMVSVIDGEIRMRQQILLACSLFALGGCITQGGGLPQIFTPKPDSAQEALNLYYNTIKDSEFPRAPVGAAMPAEDQVITRLLVGSCNDEEKESPALAQIAQEEADLFLMVGDNVYGDRDGRAYVNNDADLMELRQSFADLVARSEFQAVRAKHPMMVAWDDHDYGANDAGSEFPFKEIGRAHV